MEIGMFGITFENGKLHTMNIRQQLKASNVLFRSFDDYPRKLESAIEWLKFIGIKVADSSRHNNYLRKLNKHILAGDTLEAALAKNPDLTKILFETYELVRIHRNFDGVKPLELEAKLKFFVNGPDFYNQENLKNSNHTARNYGVEVAVGGEMTMLGLKVSYGDAGYPEPLVKTDVGNFAIECKRPFTTNLERINEKIQEAASTAINYLEVHDDADFASIVIDVTKYFNPECIAFKPESGINDSKVFREHLAPVLSLTHNLYQNERFHKLDSIILRTTYPTVSDSGKFAMQWFCRPLWIENPRGSKFFQVLHSRHEQLKKARLVEGSATLKSMLQS